MSRHLKNIVIDGLKSVGCTFVQLPATPRMDSRHRRRSGTLHSKGVRYFRIDTGIQMFWGAMDMVKEGQARKKRIVVRLSRFRDGLFELYTYHFPKHWSAACVANRELIKEAQRQAHALKHDHSLAALEWRVRFFRHYYTVFKGGAKPEPGLKPYSRFYQYTYVAIYRQLQAEARAAKEKSEAKATVSDAYIKHLAEDVSFVPVIPRRNPRVSRLPLADVPVSQLPFIPLPFISHSVHASCMNARSASSPLLCTSSPLHRPSSPLLRPSSPPFLGFLERLG